MGGEFGPHNKSMCGVTRKSWFEYVDKIHKAGKKTNGDIIGKLMVRRSICQATWYESSVGGLIVINAVYLGWQVQYKADHGVPNGGEDYVAAFFCTVFTLDVVIRLQFFRVEFFTGSDCSWNVFDFFVVSMMLIDQLLRIALKGNKAGLLSVSLGK